MTAPGILRLLSILVLGFLSCSCISSEEEIWLKGDGSGRARITVAVPNAALALQGSEKGVSRLIDKLLGGESSVSDLKTTFRRGKKRTEIEMNFRFESATKLYDSLDKSATDSEVPNAIQHIIGKTSVRREGLGVTGERRMNFGRAIPGIGLFSASGRDQRLLTIVHLPFKPTSHNATRTADRGRTLIWEVPLAEAMKAPHSQQVAYQVPPLAVITVTLVAGFAGFLLLRTLRRKWKRRTQTNCVSTSNL